MAKEVSVTQLVEVAVCERRVYLRAKLGDRTTEAQEDAKGRGNAGVSGFVRIRAGLCAVFLSWAGHIHSRATPTPNLHQSSACVHRGTGFTTTTPQETT